MNATGQPCLRTDRAAGASPLVLILGLGSSHGDDQAGWIAIDRLRPLLPWPCAAHKITSTLACLDRLPGVAALLVVDASEPQGQPGRTHRIRWPNVLVGNRARSSTHIPALRETLELAEALGWLPREVLIHTVEARDLTPGAAPGADVLRAVDDVVQALLHDARAFCEAAGHA